MPSGARLVGCAAAMLCTAVAGAFAASLIHVSAASAGGHRSDGARGLRGYRGPRGHRGPHGRTGPAGTDGLFDGTVTINWQNGRQSEDDAADFAIPGIGEGELVCTKSAQWLRVFPIDQHNEVTMWLVRQQDGLPPTVRTARHDQYTGPDFNEGLNRYRGQLVTSGSFAGLISSRGPWAGPGGPGPAPTSFHVSFNWNFSHQGSARCYVAAQFITGT